MLTPEILILIGITLLGLYIGQRLIVRNRNLNRLRRSLTAMGNGSPASQRFLGKIKPIGKVDRQTQNKLMRLLGGNQKTIDRLVNQARLKNPHQSEQWYWEKVIYDLERDRWR